MNFLKCCYGLLLIGEPHIDGDPGDLKFIIKEERYNYNGSDML